MWDLEPFIQQIFNWHSDRGELKPVVFPAAPGPANTLVLWLLLQLDMDICLSSDQWNVVEGCETLPRLTYKHFPSDPLLLVDGQFNHHVGELPIFGQSGRNILLLC